MGFAEEFIRGYHVGTQSRVSRRRLELDEEQAVADQERHAEEMEQKRKQLERQAKLDDINLRQLQLEGKRGLLSDLAKLEKRPEGAPTSINLGDETLGIPNVDVPVQTAAELRAAMLAGEEEKIRRKLGIENEAEAMNLPPEVLASLGFQPGARPQPEEANVAARVFGEKEAGRREASRESAATRGFFQAITDPTTGETVGVNFKTGKVVRAGDLDPALKGASLAGKNIDVTTQQELSGKLFALQALDGVTQQAKQLQSSFGPIMGRVLNVQIEKLGGMGASKEEQELAVRMRSLIRDVAFANGGKQLTGTEKEEFTATMPQLTDTVSQALTKAEVARDLFQKHFALRVRSIPMGARGQLDPAFFQASGVTHAGKGAQPTTTEPGVQTFDIDGMTVKVRKK